MRVALGSHLGHTLFKLANLENTSVVILLKQYLILSRHIDTYLDGKMNTYCWSRMKYAGNRCVLLSLWKNLYTEWMRTYGFTTRFHLNQFLFDICRNLWFLTNQYVWYIQNLPMNTKKLDEIRSTFIVNSTWNMNKTQVHFSIILARFTQKMTVYLRVLHQFQFYPISNWLTYKTKLCRTSDIWLIYPCHMLIYEKNRGN